MQIKLMEVGMHAFTGDIGGINFVDGISVDPISRADMDRLACVMRVEIVAEGDEKAHVPTNVSILDRSQSAEVVAPRETQTDEARKAEEADRAAKNKAPAPQAYEKSYTRAELEEIADDTGMPGLREIGGPRGVTDRSIAGLIEAILEDQKSKSAISKG